MSFVLTLFVFYLFIFIYFALLYFFNRNSICFVEPSAWAWDSILFFTRWFHWVFKNDIWLSLLFFFLLFYCLNFFFSFIAVFAIVLYDIDYYLWLVVLFCRSWKICSIWASHSLRLGCPFNPLLSSCLFTFSLRFSFGLLTLMFYNY
jgi:hypothetical protein